MITAPPLSPLEHAVLPTTGIALEMARGFWTALFMAEQESSADGVVIVSPQRQWLYYNQRFVEMWRLPAELATTGNSIQIVQHLARLTSDPAQFIENVERVYQNHEATLQDEVYLRDGRVLERLSYPVKTAEICYGRVWRYRDITKRKRFQTNILIDTTAYQQMQQQLATSEARFRHLAENARDIIYRYRLKPTPAFEYISPSITRIMGYKPEEYYADPEIGQKLVHPEDMAKLMATVTATIPATEPTTIRWVRKDGQIIWTEQENVFIRDAKGQAVAIEGVARDITRRKQAEEALQVSEERYRIIANLQSDWVFSFQVALDDTLHREWTQGAFERTTGYAPTDPLVADGLLAIVHPLDRAAFTAHMQTLLAGQPSTLECRIYTKAGEIRWLARSGHPVWNAKEKRITHIYGAVQDITQRKQAEKALHESEKRYRLLVQNLPNTAVYLFDHDLRYCLVEGLITTRTGYTRTLMEGKTIAEVLPPDRSATLTTMYRRVLAGERIHYEFTWEGRTYECHLLPMFDEHEQVTFGMVLSLDVTERQRNEAMLAQHAQELALLNDFLTATNQTYDLVQVAQVAIQQLAKLFNVTGGWLQVLETQDTGPGLRLLYAHGLPTPLETALAWMPYPAEPAAPPTLPVLGIFEKLAGNWPPYFDVEPIMAKDKVLGLLGVCREANLPFTAPEKQFFATLRHQLGIVLENVRLAEQAAQAEILREIDGFRSELIANVSHELRTPLGLIMVMATTLLRQDVAFEPAVYADFLHGIVEEADRLTHIVNNLLEASRLQNGHIQLDKQPTDLTMLAEQTLAALQPQLAQHRVRFQPPAVPLIVWVDAKHLEQVLRNLLTNAAKYSPPETHITLSLTHEAAAAEVRFYVQDEGIGISPADQPHIFERFYRSKAEAVQRVAGVGLGLSISRGLVEAHGGRIWVAPAPSQGSIFWVALPLQPKDIGDEG